MAEFVPMFGLPSIDRAQVILPTTEFFPEGWDGSDGSVEPLLRRMCGYMDVDRERLQLMIIREEEHGLREILPYWQESTKGAAGHYRQGSEGEKHELAVKLGRGSDFISVAGTIAHELGHVLLLGDGRIERSREDMEPLTDLVTVFRGTGIFTANTVMRFSQYSDGSKQGWSVKRQGYMSEEMFAYALASFARMRGEDNPAWAKHLNLNVRTYLKQSLKFLAKADHK